MKNTISNKRIPNAIAFLLIICGIGLLSYLVQHHLLFLGNANSSEAPKDVRITNISDTSFTITYTTAASVAGSVSFGKDKNLSQVALDERDQTTGNITPHTVHSITLQNLAPETTYFFSILSGGTTFINGDSLYQTTTAPPITQSPSSQNPLTGTIVLPSGENTNEVIVYAQTTNSQVLSTLVKSSGLYVLPLNALRASNLDSYLTLNKNSIMQILAADETLNSHALISVSDTGVIPTIILSKDYDFTINEQPLATSSAQSSFFLTSLLSQAVPDIIFPKDNESLIDTQPTFTGTARANSAVTITITQSTSTHTTVNANDKGFWSFHSEKILPPGKQTISITSLDLAGNDKTVQHTFTILEAGSQVVESATPSATPIVTVSPTPLPTESPTPTTLLTPMASLTPTPTSTFPSPTEIISSVTPTPTNPLIQTPTPSKTPLPPTGNGSILFVGMAGIITTIFGVILFAITQGSSL